MVWNKYGTVVSKLIADHQWWLSRIVKSWDQLDFLTTSLGLSHLSVLVSHQINIRSLCAEANCQVSSNGGSPKWMVLNGNPSMNWMIWGKPRWWNPPFFVRSQMAHFRQGRGPTAPQLPVHRADSRYKPVASRSRRSKDSSPWHRAVVPQPESLRWDPCRWTSPKKTWKKNRCSMEYWPTAHIDGPFM